jgi:hypothetical protein
MQGRVEIVPFDELSWPPVALHVQGSTNGMNLAGARPKRSEPSAMIDVPTVQRSYAEAYQCGLLQSQLIPTMEESPALPGHPLCLANRQDSLKAAMLDASKIDDIKLDLRSVLSKVPQSSDWNKVVKKERIAPDDIEAIIRLVKGDVPSKVNWFPQSERNIDTLVERFRELTGTLQSTKGRYCHAHRLAKLIECLLMQIQEHIYGGDKNASVIVSQPK